MKKKTDFKSLDIKDLKDKEKELRELLFNTKLKVITGEQKDVRLRSKIRKDIARLLTELTKKTAKK